MKLKNIISKLLLLILLFCTIQIDVSAALPYVRNTKVETLDQAIKLTIASRYNGPTSYRIQRSEIRTGTYITIADNITDLTYIDSGLENGKVYYYKIFGINGEGVGTQADFVECAPSESNYIWFDVYGVTTYIKGIDIYDIDGNKIAYSEHYFRDGVSGGTYNYYGSRLMAHQTVLINSVSQNKMYQWDTAPKTRIGLKLQPHKGIKKVKFHTIYNAPVKAEIFETIESTLTNDDTPKMKIEFLNSGQTREYEIFKSGLEAHGENKKVTLSWNNVDNISHYVVRRANDKNGVYSILDDNAKMNQFIDKNVENNTQYFYMIEAIMQDGTTKNLGTIATRTSKIRYLILDLLESYDDGININELQILDENNKVIDYGVADVSYFNISDYDNNKRKSSYSYCYNYHTFNNAKDGILDSPNYIGVVYIPQNLWRRYALELEDNNGIAKINLWTGVEKQPKGITFYTAEKYDYNNNLLLRRNENLLFFDQKNIADLDQVTKYEFTQSAPDAPQGINGVSKDTRAKIIWDKVSNADSYNVKRSASPGGPYTTIAEDVLETEYTDTGITNGTSYYYVVTALNEGGESVNSVEVSVMPNPQLPQAPMNLQVTPSANAIELTWQPVYNAESYEVMRSETEGGPYVTVLEATTANTFTDSHVTFGKTYYYVVQAKNAVGVSNNSEEIQGASGQVLPGIPTNVITKVKDKNVYITWDSANDATSYSIMRSSLEDGSYTLLQDNIRGISYRDTSVAYNDTYYYKIVAVNEKGEGEPTSPIRVNVMDTSEQQVLLSITLTNGTTKDYLFSQSQLADFMNWYQGKTENQGLPYFTVMGQNKYGAYKAHKSYILFNAILSIDIKEIQDK